MARYLIIIGIFSSLVGCASSPSSVQEPQSTPIKQQKIDTSTYPKFAQEPNYQAYFQEWKGVPYKYGGINKQGIDCSAFTQDALQALHQYSLPRSTAYQASSGIRVSLNNAKKGDLVFFKTGRKVRHVGVYIGNNEFMHASTSKGVIISSLENPYWKKTYWQIRRVL